MLPDLLRRYTRRSRDSMSSNEAAECPRIDALMRMHQHVG